MLALSTSYRSRQAAFGDTLIAQLDRFDIDGLELEYRMDAGLFRQVREALKRSRLTVVSVTIHDAVGLDDHLAPGTGSIDFRHLKPFIKKDTLLVVELKPGTPDRHVSQGIRFLRENVL